MLNAFLYIFRFPFQREEDIMRECWQILDSSTNYNRGGFDTTGRLMCFYGDPAYPHRVHLQCPYRHARLTVQQEAFNIAMSTVRESVEWLFRDIIEYFKFLDFKKNLKLQLCSVGKYYIVCAIFPDRKSVV